MFGNRNIKIIYPHIVKNETPKKIFSTLTNMFVIFCKSVSKVNHCNDILLLLSNKFVRKQKNLENPGLLLSTISLLRIIRPFYINRTPGKTAAKCCQYKFISFL